MAFISLNLTSIMTVRLIFSYSDLVTVFLQQIDHRQHTSTQCRRLFHTSYWTTYLALCAVSHLRKKLVAQEKYNFPALYNYCGIVSISHRKILKVNFAHNRQRNFSSMIFPQQVDNKKVVQRINNIMSMLRWENLMSLL